MTTHHFPKECEFPSYVGPGDTITTYAEGFTITARIEHDTCYRIDDDDCHNPNQSVTGCNDEQQARLMAAREAWFRDEWFYAGVVLSVAKNGVVLDNHAAYLWGIEANYPGSTNEYLTSVADDMIGEAIARGKAVLASLLDT